MSSVQAEMITLTNAVLSGSPAAKVLAARIRLIIADADFTQHEDGVFEIRAGTATIDYWPNSGAWKERGVAVARRGIKPLISRIEGWKMENGR